MSASTKHTCLTLAILVLLALITDAIPFYMPDMATMSALVAIVILVIVWAAFLVREQAEDERDSLHALTAGRYSYLAGIATLTLALCAQGLSHNIDPWIVISLGVMLIAKLGARWYTDKYQ
ncbi:MAG: hypothetical protein WAX38_03030 [Minisyncoccia bacterium]